MRVRRFYRKLFRKAQGPSGGRGKIGVGSKGEDTAAEIQLPGAVFVSAVCGTAAFIQNGHKDFQDFRMGLFQLVEHEDGAGILADSVENRRVLIAHITRRCARQPVDGVRLCEGIQFGPDGLEAPSAAGLQGRCKSFAKFGLPYAGRPIENQGQGPYRSDFPGMAVKAESGGFNSGVLPQDRLPQSVPKPEIERGPGALGLFSGYGTVQGMSKRMRPGRKAGGGARG